jgi:hypothetical protein
MTNPPLHSICRLFPRLSEDELDGRGVDSPLKWALARNLRRRQFNASQRAVLALEVLPMLQKEAEQRQRIGANGGYAQQCAHPPLKGEAARGRATHHAARLMGASSRYIQAAAWRLLLTGSVRLAMLPARRAGMCGEAGVRADRDVRSPACFASTSPP